MTANRATKAMGDCSSIGPPATVTGAIEGEDIRYRREPNLQDRLSIQIAVSTALLRGQEAERRSR